MADTQQAQGVAQQAPTSIFALRENVLNLYNAVEAEANWLAQAAANPEIELATLQERETRMTELQARHDLAAQALSRAEGQQRERMMQDEGSGILVPDSANKVDVKAFAGFLRALKSHDGAGVQHFRAKLGAIPEGDAALGMGENLLPRNMTNQLIHEPLDINPMRDVVSISAITNLEMPRIAFTLDDDNFITDKQTAKEMALRGDRQQFGRFKFKVMTNISDTVMYGTETDLVSYVQNTLASGFATKEKKQMFGLDGDLAAAEQHMSFYSATNAIKKVSGATMFDAILNGLGDLHDQFAERATVVMRRLDYLQMIRELANTSATFWGAKPQDVIGVPVVFCDKAVTPVIGDMQQARINYDIRTVYDEDKDVKSGDYIFVVTGWIDIQYLLTSAFRLIEVTP